MSDTPDGNEHGDSPAKAQPAWGLWMLCVVIGAVLLVAWAGDRAKPWVVFPLAFGAAFGGWASAVGVWCDAPRRRSAVLFIALGATVLVPATYFLAARQHQAQATLSNPLAEQLMRQFEKQAPAEGTRTEVTNGLSLFWTDLQQRYHRKDTASLLAWLVGEGLLAGGMSTVVMMCGWRMREPVAR